MRSLAKQVVPATVRYAIRSQQSQIRTHGLAWTVRWNAILASAKVRARLAASRYRELAADEVRATRTSETVFIFGSGYSLNDISPLQWQRIAEHNTFGFTAFIYQQWVRTDYHLIRGGYEGSLLWRPYAEEFSGVLAANPLFDSAILFMQSEYEAMFANQLRGQGMLKPGTRIFGYHTLRGVGLPTLAFEQGIRHGIGTLCDAVNVAVCMGWQRIVLAGVDLYDSRYFYVPPDQTLLFDPATGIGVPAQVNNRGLAPHETHNTALNGIVATLGEWREYLLRERGVQLSVLNPKSLLTGVMPVHELAT